MLNKKHTEVINLFTFTKLTKLSVLIRQKSESKKTYGMILQDGRLEKTVVNDARAKLKPNKEYARSNIL